MSKFTSNCVMSISCDGYMVNNNERTERWICFRRDVQHDDEPWWGQVVLHGVRLHVKEHKRPISHRVQTYSVRRLPLPHLQLFLQDKERP